MKWTRGGSAREEKGLSLTPRGVLLLLAGALVLAYLVGWRVTGGRAAREIERLRQRGEPLRPSELLPKLARGEKNAADLYEKAFDSGPTPALDTLTSTDHTQWTPAEHAAARAAVKGNAEYFALLDRASRTKTCILPVDWDNPFPDLSFASKLRDAARTLRVRAEVQLRQGDGDGALATLGITYRMAAQSWQMPEVTGYLVGASLDGIAQADLPRVLDAGTPSPAACRALYEQLGRQHPTPAFVRALRGERAVGLLVFQAVEAGQQLNPRPDSLLSPQGGRVLTAYARLGRPAWYREKAAYLALMATTIAAAGEPWPDADTAIASALDHLGGPRRMLLAAQLAQPLEQTVWVRDRTAAKLGLARIALALKAYQAEHGQYPASLAMVEQTGWPLPTDPFTGKPFHYRREPSGFTIWSTGVDMVDNRGVQGTPPSPRRAPGGGYVPGCDCTLRCAK